MIKRIDLKHLQFKNFKGVQSFESDFSKTLTIIKGPNGAGKTTVYDAYLWLLFDKDSFNRKDFGIKTVDKNGDVIHHLEHEVVAILTIDGKDVKLSKIYKEQWTKRNGSTESELKSHTTKYKVDDVPHKKGDYDNYIKSIIDEETFRIISSTTYFNDNVKWQDRRKTLLDMGGDVTDQDVINKTEELKDLPDMMGNHTVDNFEKVLKDRRTELKKDIEHIPTRIDELHMNKISVDGTATAKVKIKEIDIKVDKKQKELMNINNGSELRNKENQLKETENNLKERQNELEKELIEQGTKISEELTLLKSDYANVNNKIRMNQNNIEQQEDWIKQAEEQMAQLKEEYKVIAQQEFNIVVEENCPTCEQSLPTDQVETVKQKKLEEYNLNRSKKVESINSRGVALKNEVSKWQEAIDNINKENEKLKSNLQDIEKKIKQLESKLVNKRGELVEARESDGILNELYSTKNLILGEIEQLESKQSDVVEKLEEELKELKESKKEHEVLIAQVANNKMIDERIDKLNEEHAAYIKQLEKIEYGLHLIGLFIQKKVSMLTDSINSYFNHTKWKLFDIQVNGGIKETCVATYNGVPYDAGLNTGARIKVGLDIANTLSKHYGVQAPIFVDNAESVTGVLNTDSQLIELRVDDREEGLTIDLFKRDEDIDF